MEFDFDDSFELQEEVVKQDMFNDAYNHSMDIDPMNGVMPMPVHPMSSYIHSNTHNDDYLDKGHAAIIRGGH
jgi:hypothetical protein